MTIPGSLRMLADSLERLGAEPSVQIAYLTSLGVGDLSDELALEFDDYYRPKAADLANLSPECAKACARLDCLLSDGRLDWTFEGLGSPEWVRIRDVAKTALAALTRDTADDYVNEL